MQIILCIAVGAGTFGEYLPSFQLYHFYNYVFSYIWFYLLLSLYYLGPSLSSKRRAAVVDLRSRLGLISVE